MSSSTDDDRQFFTDLINQQLNDLHSQLRDNLDSAAVVELDQSRVGRVSRMDALQAQAMHKEMVGLSLIHI